MADVRAADRPVIVRRADPLVVVASLKGAREPIVIDLREWPGSEVLRTQLADSFEALTSSGGTWKTKQTAGNGCTVVKHFAAFCESAEVKRLHDLTRAHWNDYLLQVQATGKKSTHRAEIGRVRLAVGRYPQRLRPEVAEVLRRRLPKRDTEVIQPYRDDEFDAIRKAAQAVVNAAHKRMKPERKLLTRRRETALEPTQAVRVNALREVAATGGPQSSASREALGVTVAEQRQLGVVRARALLFATKDEVMAMAVLLACGEGVNPTQLDERDVPSAAPGLGVREDIMSVEDEKRRRGKHPYDAHAIPKHARRNTIKIIEITETAREYLSANGLPGDNQLLAYWPGYQGGAPLTGVPVSRYGRKGPRWWPAGVEPLDFRRIRKNYVVCIDPGPQGHSRATWATTYVAGTEAERERMRGEVVEVGLWKLITNAQEHLKMRFQRLDTGPDTDTPIAGCADWEHHPLTGQPCGDDFLLCLQCDNALATPRHLPRLVALRDALAALASTDGPDWTDFRADAYGCLLSLLNNRNLIMHDELTAAQRCVTDIDRYIITTMLSGRLS